MSAGQALQDDEPEALMLPGEQALQAVPSEEKVPALHGLQTPFTGAEPASHFLTEHDVWPVAPFVVLPVPQGTHCWQDDSKVSAGQALQVVAPEPLIEPGLHALQAVPSVEKVPALQGLQTPFTSAEPASHFLTTHEV